MAASAIEDETVTVTETKIRAGRKQRVARPKVGAT